MPEDGQGLSYLLFARSPDPQVGGRGLLNPRHPQGEILHLRKAGGVDPVDGISEVAVEDVADEEDRGLLDEPVFSCADHHDPVILQVLFDVLDI